MLSVTIRTGESIDELCRKSLWKNVMRADTSNVNYTISAKRVNTLMAEKEGITRFLRH